MIGILDNFIQSRNLSLFEPLFALNVKDFPLITFNLVMNAVKCASICDDCKRAEFVSYFAIAFELFLMFQCNFVSTISLRKLSTWTSNFLVSLSVTDEVDPVPY